MNRRDFLKGLAAATAAIAAGVPLSLAAANARDVMPAVFGPSAKITANGLVLDEFLITEQMVEYSELHFATHYRGKVAKLNDPANQKYFALIIDDYDLVASDLGMREELHKQMVEQFRRAFA